jgi:ABC-2 type transport system ATP-binding protein
MTTSVAAAQPIKSCAAEPHTDAALLADHIVKEFAPAGLERLLGRKKRAPYRAVDDVSFSVRPGEIFGVIGANGSGKSTLIRIISTLLLPDSGAVRVFGHDPVRDPLSVRPLINRVSADPSFFRPMSPMENLLFFGRAYGLTGDAPANPCFSYRVVNSRRSRSPARSSPGHG